jgi:type I restriction enzyme, S subunit
MSGWQVSSKTRLAVPVMNSDPPPGWSLKRLGDLTVNLDRRRVPLSEAQRAERRGPYPYWGANGPFDSIDDYLFEGPHVLIAEDGNTVMRSDGRGTVHWADGRFWVNNHAHVLHAAPGVYLRWLYFALSDVSIRPYVTGSAQPKLNQRNLNAVLVRTPPEREQARIAAILGALDDKIDSNRRLSRLLEATLAALFKARCLGSPAAEVATLASLVDLAKDQVSPAESPSELFEHFSIPAFDSGALPELARGESMLSNKTLVPGRECVLLSKLNPRIKRVWWPWPSGVGSAVCSPEFLVLVPRPGIPTSFLYATGSADDRFYEELLGHATGTTGSRQRVKPTDALSCHVTLVPKAELLEWDAMARPMYDWAHSLLAETRRLAEVRDLLLPRLVSGEIRVPDSADSDDAIEPLLEERVA